MALVIGGRGDELGGVPDAAGVGYEHAVGGGMAGLTDLEGVAATVVVVGGVAEGGCEVSWKGEGKG